MLLREAHRVFGAPPFIVQILRHAENKTFRRNQPRIQTEILPFQFRAQ